MASPPIGIHRDDVCKSGELSLQISSTHSETELLLRDFWFSRRVSRHVCLESSVQLDEGDEEHEGSIFQI